MIQKKVVLLGATGVGKTSLVRRFVESLFDESYLTTIGVKVDKKQVRVGDVDVLMMLWDVAGAEERFTVPSSYIRGAAGLLLVVDGTRPETLAAATGLIAQAHRDAGPVPAVVAVNKADMVDHWRIADGDLQALRDRGGTTLRTSAKTGDGVESAFLAIAEAMVR